MGYRYINSIPRRKSRSLKKCQLFSFVFPFWSIVHLTFDFFANLFFWTFDRQFLSVRSSNVHERKTLNRNNRRDFRDYFDVSAEQNEMSNGKLFRWNRMSSENDWFAFVFLSERLNKIKEDKNQKKTHVNIVEDFLIVLYRSKKNANRSILNFLVERRRSFHLKSIRFL